MAEGATVSIMQDKQQYVVSLRFMEKSESMQEIVSWLLNRLKSIEISIKRA
jgi:hypothetical protein